MMAVVRRIVPFLGKLLLVLGLLAILVAIVTVSWFRHDAEDARPVEVSGEVALPRGTRAIELWFPEAAGQGLVLETREVVEDAVEGDALVRTVVTEFLRGPEHDMARSAFPEGLSLTHVYADPAGGLYLDFSPELRRDFRGGSTAEMLLVSSLLRTVAANAPTVTRVTITAGGQPIVTLGGHVRLDGPLLMAEWR